LFKKITFLLILLAAIAAGTYSYFYVKKIKTPVSEAINAVPLNASIIVESRQVKNLWKKLSETSIMWEDLLGTAYFSRLNRTANFLDSSILMHPKIAAMMDNHSVFLSVHPSGANSYDFLYLYSLPNVTQQYIVDEFVKETCKSPLATVRDYDGQKIYSLQLSPSETFTYSFAKGIFISSFSSVLVEDALRQLASGNSLMKNKSFAAVQRSAGDKVEASLYINYKTLPGFIGRYFLNESSKKEFTHLSDFADWTELDLVTKPNSLMLNGFTTSDDSLKNYLSLFLKQKPQQIELTSIVPSNTSTLLFFGISNFKGFYSSYKSYLELKHKLFDYQQELDKLKLQYGLQPEKQILSWINNEMALVITEPTTTNYNNDCYAIFHSNNKDEALNKLNEFADTVDRINELKADTELFRGHMIRQLALQGILPKILGTPFEKMQDNFFTAINDYIVFANTSVALKSFINSYESGRTLQNSKYYTSFSENLSTEANVYLYSGIAQSTNIYSALVDEENAKAIEAYTDIYHKFEAIGIQFSSNEKMFFNNIYLKHNPIYKQETSSVWEVALDDSLIIAPCLMVNHNTKAKEVFVQDRGNKIYLISNTGKILWKKQLPEKIIGQVQQVDILKNNKLQMLFTTRSSIYVIDRNGKYYGAFPLKLKSPASNAASVFDYDGNRDYRILVACEDKKIYNYKTSGELITGWKFGKTENRVTLPVKHCMINDKDYIVAIDALGKISVMDRQGATRLKMKDGINGIAGRFYLEAGKDPGRSYIVSSDTLGNIIKLSFNGDVQNIRLKNFDTRPYLLYNDINDDKTKEYILVDEGQINVFNQDKTLLYNYPFNPVIDPAASYFTYGNNKGKIGIVARQTHELFLLDENGQLMHGFPLFGSSAFEIGDVNNDGVFYLIAGNEDRIYAYLLQ